MAERINSRRATVLRIFAELGEELNRIGHGIKEIICNTRRILDSLEIIMSNQEHLDQSVAQLGTQFQQVADEVQALKDQVAAGQTPLDFSGLDAAVQQVSDAVPDAAPAGDQGAPAPEEQA